MNGYIHAATTAKMFAAIRSPLQDKKILMRCSVGELDVFSRGKTA